MGDYSSSSHFVVSLQSESCIYHKTSSAWGKNLWHQREGSTNRKLERTK